jgi:hypothetical protein
MAHHDESYYHCYFRRQPETPDEVNSALRAVWSSCCQVLRYSGNDHVVLTRLGHLGQSSACDYPLVSCPTELIRDRVTFTIASSIDDPQSNLKTILQFLADSLVGNPLHSRNEKFSYKKHEASFRHYWSLPDHRNFIEIRLKKRSQSAWMCSVEDNEVAAIGMAMTLDKTLHANPQFENIRWFATTEDPDRDPGQPHSY